MCGSKSLSAVLKRLLRWKPGSSRAQAKGFVEQGLDDECSRGPLTRTRLLVGVAIEAFKLRAEIVGAAEPSIWMRRTASEAARTCQAIICCACHKAYRCENADSSASRQVALAGGPRGNLRADTPTGAIRLQRPLEPDGFRRPHSHLPVPASFHAGSGPVETGCKPSVASLSRGRRVGADPIADV